LSEVKTELGIADSSKDSRLASLIRSASLFIGSKMGREPWLQTYVDRIPGEGGTVLYLPHWPCLGSPTSVTLGTGASPSTITASTYSVVDDDRRDRLYRANGWTLTTRDIPASIPAPEDRDFDYNITYQAGWVMPDKIIEWEKSEEVAANEWYRASDRDFPLIFQAGGAGTTGATEPGWAANAAKTGDTITDNDITWTAHRARLPRPIEEAALILTLEFFSGSPPTGVKREAFEGRVIEYFDRQEFDTVTVDALIRPYMI
jgi:hypothetical protein